MDEKLEKKFPKACYEGARKIIVKPRGLRPEKRQKGWELPGAGVRTTLGLWVPLWRDLHVCWLKGIFSVVGGQKYRKRKIVSSAMCLIICIWPGSLSPKMKTQRNKSISILFMLGFMGQLWRNTRGQKGSALKVTNGDLSEVCVSRFPSVALRLQKQGRSFPPGTGMCPSRGTWDPSGEGQNIVGCLHNGLKVRGTREPQSDLPASAISSKGRVPPFKVACPALR